MLTHAFFLSNRRESLVRAFRKKTPLSVRRTWGGGAKGGTESVHRNMTFSMMASLTPLFQASKEKFHRKVHAQMTHLRQETRLRLE